MIEIITFVVLLLSSIYYVYCITRVRIGLLSLRFAQSKNAICCVSVVVAARNEENNIEKCLQSMLSQTYPADKYEIIIVDDGSTDKTASIVQSFSKRFANVHLLSLELDSTHKIGRKPIALAKGIAQATGEIILTTDADCLVPPQWIGIMVNHFEEGVVFVAGPVAERDSNTFFAKMERLEFLGLITTAAGLIGSGRPIICNGANLAYRKDAFASIDGFNAKSNSNDDESLMNKVVHRKIGRVVFAPEADAVVTTSSSNTISTFFRQRIRWANKRGHYEDASILFTLVGLYIFFASMLLTMILLFHESQLIQPLLAAFGCKILVDYFTLRSGARLFRQRIPIFHFLIAEFLHVPYIVITAAIGQVASMQWKGLNHSAMRSDMRILQLLFPSVLFTTTAAGIHLTFDDGPHPTATPAVLNILKERNIQATFFFLGQNVQQYPDIAKQVASEGHRIGNHSYTHANLFFKDEAFIQKEIIQTEEILESNLGKRTRFFRPPYGYLNLTILNVLKEVGLTCALWSIDSKDYRLNNKFEIENRVLPYASNGSILLFHDNKETAQKLHSYLPSLLDIFLEKKFIFKPLQS